MDRGVPASVGKQVALYLSRVAPRQTIDHLVYELSQQLTEAEAEGEAQEASSPLAGVHGCRSGREVEIREAYSVAYSEVGLVLQLTTEGVEGRLGHRQR